MEVPLTSEHGTYKAFKARFWPWLSGTSVQNFAGLGFQAQVFRTQAQVFQSWLSGTNIQKQILFARIRTFARLWLHLYLLLKNVAGSVTLPKLRDLCHEPSLST